MQFSRRLGQYGLAFGESLPCCTDANEVTEGIYDVPTTAPNGSANNSSLIPRQQKGHSLCRAPTMCVFGESDGIHPAPTEADVYRLKPIANGQPPPLIARHAGINVLGPREDAAVHVDQLFLVVADLAQEADHVRAAL